MNVRKVLLAATAAIGLVAAAPQANARACFGVLGVIGGCIGHRHFEHRYRDYEWHRDREYRWHHHYWHHHYYRRDW